MNSLDDQNWPHVKRLRPSGLKTERKGRGHLGIPFLGRRTGNDRRHESQTTDSNERSGRDRRNGRDRRHWSEYTDLIELAVKVLSSEQVEWFRRELDLVVAESLEGCQLGTITKRFEDGSFSFEIKREPSQEELKAIRSEISNAMTDANG